MMTKKRIIWIDQVKGFAIILMILFHSIPGYTIELKNWISAFNMPLFFFVAGVLNRNKKYRLSDFPKYLKTKFFSLGVPYYFFCILYCVFIACLSIVARAESHLIFLEFMSGIKDTFLFIGVESMWFISVYLLASFIYDFFLVRFLERESTSIAICVILILFILHLNQYVALNEGIRMFGKVGAALVFIISGNWLKTSLEKPNSFTLFALLFLSSFLAITNGFVSVNFQYGKYPILFFFNAIIMSFCLCSLFSRFSNLIPSNVNKVLCMYGMYSIVLVVTNNIILEILRLVDYKLFGDFCLNNGLLGYFLFAVIILFMEYPVIILAKSKLGFLFGKSPVITN